MHALEGDLMSPPIRISVRKVRVFYELGPIEQPVIQAPVAIEYLSIEREQGGRRNFSFEQYVA